VSRTSALAARLLPVLGVIAVLAGCGAPPQPLPTSPPEAPSSSGAFPSPSAGVPVPGQPLPGVQPGVQPGGLPTGALPPGGLPTGYPIYPAPTLATTTAPRTTPPSPTPSPAGRCTNGPTKQQVLGVVKGKPGIPANRDLRVTEGPYCSGSWQFTIVGIAGEGPDDVEPLLVVTNGRPSALKLIEAGADVCTERVEDDAPAGIRVRACGA
jgi:hypothetical protein